MTPQTLSSETFNARYISDRPTPSFVSVSLHKRHLHMDLFRPFVATRNISLYCPVFHFVYFFKLNLSVLV